MCWNASTKPSSQRLEDGKAFGLRFFFFFFFFFFGFKQDQTSIPALASTIVNALAATTVLQITAQREDTKDPNVFHLYVKRA
jgi:hypothetical protein